MQELNIDNIDFSVAFNQVMEMVIEKGTKTERAARNDNEKTCDYLSILDKRIDIQQRALAC